MASGNSGSCLQDVGRLFHDGTLVGLSDAQLLARFRDTRDEAAFEALVSRHGPMVLGVCRAVLCDRTDAEDAFQATFLILVRKAGGLRVGDSLAGWLYRVARRTARQARIAHVARRRREQLAAVPAHAPTCPPGDAELRSVVHEEIDRLPEVYRAPIVLCLLEGLKHEEAAQRLRWPVGTVSGRLSRGRERLRTRLARRGIALAVVALAEGTLSPPAGATVTASLARTTARLAGMQFTDRAVVATTAAGTLSEGVIKAMLKQVIFCAVAIGLATVVTTGGAIALAQRGVTRSKNDLVDDRPKRSDPPVTLRYGDGTPDGKKSLGGSGEMIEFTRPQVAGLKVSGLKIHGARYGLPEPPDEQFLIYFLSASQDEIINTQMAPYALFERVGSRWVDVKFKKPVAVPAHFWVVLDFRAHQTKGVYVSFDASTGGKHSRLGLPGLRSRPAPDGDWMVELVLAE